jgi:hypothetical protein
MHMKCGWALGKCVCSSLSSFLVWAREDGERSFY